MTENPRVGGSIPSVNPSIGYRIVKSYYEHSAYKRAAIRQILQVTDPRAFLAKSGWYPGIKLR
jgi:hypothetical protein